MPTTVRALVIEAGALGTTYDVRPNLATLQTIVGGMIEAVNGDGWHLYCDEEGRLKGYPRNPVATVLATRLLGHTPVGGLVGTVVFLGTAGDGEGDVPEAVLAEHRAVTAA